MDQGPSQNVLRLPAEFASKAIRTSVLSFQRSESVRTDLGRLKLWKVQFALWFQKEAVDRGAEQSRFTIVLLSQLLSFSKVDWLFSSLVTRDTHKSGPN